MATRNSYDSILTSKLGGGELRKYYSLSALNDPRIDWPPYSTRILLVLPIQNCDEFQVTGKDVEKILDWENTASKQVQISFKPAHVLLQDFTGVPAVVDLACMRDAMNKLSCDSSKINPLVPVDVVIDHSVQVDAARSENAVQANMELEFHHNKDLLGFLKWGSNALRGILVVPPRSGIAHQENLEHITRVASSNEEFAETELKLRAQLGSFLETFGHVFQQAVRLEKIILLRVKHANQTITHISHSASHFCLF